MSGDRIGANRERPATEIARTHASTVSAAERGNAAAPHAELVTHAHRNGALAAEAALHVAMFFLNAGVGRFASQSFLMGVKKNVTMAEFQAAGAIGVALTKTFGEALGKSVSPQLEAASREKLGQYLWSKSFYRDVNSVLEAAAYGFTVFIVNAAFKSLLAKNNTDFLKGMGRWETRLGLAGALATLDLAYKLMLLGVVWAGQGKDRATYKRPPLNPLNNENARAVVRAANPVNWVSFSSYKKNNRVTNQVMVDGASRVGALALLGDVAYPNGIAKYSAGVELAQARGINIVLGLVLRLVRARVQEMAVNKMGGYRANGEMRSRITELPDTAPDHGGTALLLTEVPASRASSQDQSRLSQDERTSLPVPLEERNDAATSSTSQATTMSGRTAESAGLNALRAQVLTPVEPKAGEGSRAGKQPALPDSGMRLPASGLKSASSTEALHAQVLAPTGSQSGAGSLAALAGLLVGGEATVEEDQPTQRNIVRAPADTKQKKQAHQQAALPTSEMPSTTVAAQDESALEALHAQVFAPAELQSGAESMAALLSSGSPNVRHDNATVSTAAGVSTTARQESLTDRQHAEPAPLHPAIVAAAQNGVVSENGK